jgi:nucleoside-diphosphate-sugar epimerase
MTTASSSIENRQDAVFTTSDLVAFPGPAAKQNSQRGCTARPSPRRLAILGCGYVGSHLARFWKEQGYQVTVTTTRPERQSVLEEFADQVLVMKGNDPESIDKLLQDQDAIVVCVAPTGSDPADIDTYQFTYLQTIRNLVAVLPDHPQVHQVIYLSSCSVYGDHRGGWVKETSPVAPQGKAKILLAAEELLQQASTSTRHICIFRLGGIYGPERELVEQFRSLAGSTLPGNGRRIVNWIHVEDIVTAIDFARHRSLRGIYNLVNHSKLSARVLADRICRKYQLPHIHWDPSQKSFRSHSLKVDNRKLLRTGYRLRHARTLV